MSRYTDFESLLEEVALERQRSQTLSHTWLAGVASATGTAVLVRLAMLQLPLLVGLAPVGLLLGPVGFLSGALGALTLYRKLARGADPAEIARRAEQISNAERRYNEYRATANVDSQHFRERVDHLYRELVS